MKKTLTVLIILLFSLSSLFALPHDLEWGDSIDAIIQKMGYEPEEENYESGRFCFLEFEGEPDDPFNSYKLLIDSEFGLMKIKCSEKLTQFNQKERMKAEVSAIKEILSFDYGRAVLSQENSVCYEGLDEKAELKWGTMNYGSDMAIVLEYERLDMDKVMNAIFKGRLDHLKGFI